MKIFFHEEGDNRFLNLNDINIMADAIDDAVPAIEPMLPLVVMYDSDDRSVVSDLA